MKESGTTHWQSPNTAATNISYFSALPGGQRWSGVSTVSSTGLTVSVFGGALLAGAFLLFRWRRTPRESADDIEITALFTYPIKSCAPVCLDAAMLDRFGFVDDRRLMVVAAEPYGGSHAFLTQRQLPRMCLIQCELRDDDLQLLAPGRQPLTVPLKPPAPNLILSVRVWSDGGLTALDLGEGAAAWLSAFLETSVRLVSASHPAWKRELDARYLPWGLRWAWGGPQVGFADGFPVLLASSSSLDELNRRLAPGAPLPMNRFRPNIVVSGCDAFDEDTWRRIRIGDNTFRVVKGCSRCKVTTTDQATAEQGTRLGADGQTAEPLATLGRFRAVGPEVYFAANLVHEWPPPVLERALRWLRGQPGSAPVCVGDRICVLERGEPVWDQEAVRAAAAKSLASTVTDESPQ